MAPAPAVASIITHPACARDTDVWLTRVATPVEHARAVSLLSSLGPGGLTDVPTQGQSDTAKPKKQRPVVAAGGKGWTYTTTRNARLNSAPGSPAQAWTQELLTGADTSAPSLNLPPPSPSDAVYAQEEDYTYSATPASHRPSAPEKQWGAVPAEVAMAIAAKQLKANQPATGSVAMFGEDQAPDVTTYQLAFHLAQMHPDLYQQALAATKAKPAANGHFVSDWGDSLKRGVDASWTARFLRSVYDITNDEVYQDPGPPSARGGAQPPGEAGFFRWLARQRTYYRGLFKEGVQPAIDQKLLIHGQHGTLDALRQLSAVARPDLLISHSQATHHPMRTCEDPELTALIRERTRIRTMGFPPPQIEGTYPTIAARMRDVELAASGGQSQQPTNEPTKVDIVFGRDGSSGQNGLPSGRRISGGAAARRPASSAGRNGQRLPGPERQRPASAFAALPGQQGDASGGLSGGAPMRHGVRLSGPPVQLEKETFKSKLPIKWACAAGLAHTSTYAQAFGSLAGGAGRRLASAGAAVPVRYKEVTCPIGAVNPVTAMAPARSAYPVPECFTTTKPFPQGPGDATMATISRSSFATRDPTDVARTLRASMEATARAKADGSKSTIALGKGAMCLLPSSDWKSEKQENYKQHTGVDIAGDAARAAALKALMSGPTASAGKLTAKHPERRAAPAPVVAVA